MKTLSRTWSSAAVAMPFLLSSRSPVWLCSQR